jgi:uncharacterized protein
MMKTMAKVAAAVLFGILLAGAARADENSVSVLGKGEVKVKPDVAIVTMYVKADALTMVDAAKQAGEKVDEVKKALKIYKQIKSIDVSDAAVGELQKRVFTPADDKEEGQHPEVIRRLRITMSPNPAKVYQLIDTAISAGAVMQLTSLISYPYGERLMVVYGVLNSADAETQARQAAMADAKKQAEALAALSGKKVGSVIKLTSDRVPPDSKLTVQIMERDDTSPATYTSHSSEEVAVPSCLTVVFELKSK